MAADPDTALELLDEGLSLVTGDPLGDVVDALGPVAAAEAQRLADLVLRARETRVEALLGVGRAPDAATVPAAEHLLVGGAAAGEPARPPAAGALPERSPDRRPPPAYQALQ